MPYSTLQLLNPISLSDLSTLSLRATDVVSALRSGMLMPNAKKSPPMLSGDQVAEICGLSKGQMSYRVRAGAPAGTVNVRGGRRELTVAEAQTWARTERMTKLRPAGSKAVTIAVAFFKGGVTKTTTTMVLAQGLSLLGHRVLTIDMDPQGSLTTLHGILPDRDLDYKDTLAPLFDGSQSDVRYAIRQSYWPNVDIIPSAGALFSAEYNLPRRQLADPSFAYWDVLNAALDVVRDEYDVILIDTPPSLSFMTVNAFLAADGVVVPMTTNMLDMASSAQFLKLFSEMAPGLANAKSKIKAYEFVHVLLSKVNNQDSTTAAVREWIKNIFGEKLMSVEIPLTAVASGQVNQFRTAYDISKYEGDSRTYTRARDAYDALARAMEDTIRRVWARQQMLKEAA